MSKFLEYFLNWWMSRPANIFLGGESVYIKPDLWKELSWVIFLAFTILPIVISILICYTATHKQGGSFLMRWWLFMIATAIVNFALIFIFLQSKTFVAGSTDAPVYWSIPTFMIISRAFVGMLQTFVFYYILSIIIVKLLGGIFNFTKFRVNLAYPFPRLFRG